MAKSFILNKDRLSKSINLNPNHIFNQVKVKKIKSRKYFKLSDLANYRSNGRNFKSNYQDSYHKINSQYQQTSLKTSLHKSQSITIENNYRDHRNLRTQNGKLT